MDPSTRSVTRIAVTGAAGLVGRSVVRAAAARGLAVVPLVRPGGRATSAANARACDLADEDGLARSFEGCDAVVHAAARMDGAEVELFAVNVDGTRNVLRACERVGVRSCAYLSSVAVYGTGDLLQCDESHPLAPTTAYGRSKVEAERVFADAPRGRTGTWILRPTTVWSGEDLTGFSTALMQVALHGRIPLVRAGRTRIDLVAADDLARACVLAACADPPPEPRIVHVTSGERLTVVAIVGRLRALGVPARTVELAETSQTTREVPAWLLAGVSEHRSFTIDRARRELGYAPQCAFPEGLDRLLVTGS